MDDARELQYGVGFETSDADSSIEQLTQKVDELEQKLGAVEMGAQKFGAGTVSACTAARNGAAAFSDAADDAAAAAQNVGNATSAAEKTTRQFGSGLDDAALRQERASPRASAPALLVQSTFPQTKSKALQRRSRPERRKSAPPSGIRLRPFATTLWKPFGRQERASKRPGTKQTTRSRI